MKGKVLGAIIGGGWFLAPSVVAVAATPVVLTAVGFTGAGIAAGSIAAQMMSAAAIANGGGVAAGSLVATLQSVGVLGLSTSTNIILGAVGAATGAAVGAAAESAGASEEQEPPEQDLDLEENISTCLTKACKNYPRAITQ